MVWGGDAEGVLLRSLREGGVAFDLSDRFSKCSAVVFMAIIVDEIYHA